MPVSPSSGISFWGLGIGTISQHAQSVAVRWLSTPGGKGIMQRWDGGMGFIGQQEGQPMLGPSPCCTIAPVVVVTEAVANFSKSSLCCFPPFPLLLPLPWVHNGVFGGKGIELKAGVELGIRKTGIQIPTLLESSLGDLCSSYLFSLCTVPHGCYRDKMTENDVHHPELLEERIG